jgi:hypothetical protein
MVPGMELPAAVGCAELRPPASSGCDCDVEFARARQAATSVARPSTCRRHRHCCAPCRPARHGSEPVTSSHLPEQVIDVISRGSPGQIPELPPLKRSKNHSGGAQQQQQQQRRLRRPDAPAAAAAHRHLCLLLMADMQRRLRPGRCDAEYCEIKAQTFQASTAEAAAPGALHLNRCACAACSGWALLQ